jgi:hypothetical protein
MAKQINVFLENKPGRISRVTATLAEAGINIRAIEIQARSDYGIMKLLVNDPQKAQIVLTDAGLAAALKDVLAVVIEDQPGGLHAVAEAFEEANVNIIDGYGFLIESSRTGVWCVEVEDLEKAKEIVENKGFRYLSEVELYEL